MLLLCIFGKGSHKQIKRVSVQCPAQKTLKCKMSNIAKYTRLIFRTCIRCLLGLLVFLIILIYILLSVPVFLYRVLVCKIAAPLCRKDLGKPVTLLGSLMATELKGKSRKLPSRCAIVTSIVFNGTLTFEEFQEMVRTRWVNGENPNGGGPRYPEFQQYITHWMGYFFWKRDPEFDLDNHVKHHSCKDDWSEEECEKFVCSLNEDLLNQQFPSNRSPWEAHLVSNFRNSDAVPGGKVSSVLVFRFHHSIADGFAIFSAICEGLLEIPLSKCLVATPSKAKQPGVHQDSKFLSKLVKFSMLPVKILRDVGYVISKTSIPLQTPFIVPDENKTWRQIYYRSGLLPISKFKRVRDEFGVSFTAVLLSCISAGIANTLKSKKLPNNIKKLPFSSAFPALSGHSYKLRNHATMAFLELPTDQFMSSLKRLKSSDKYFQKAKRSAFPYLVSFATRIFAPQVSPIPKHLFTNRALSAGMTNFPGSTVPLNYKDLDVATKDFAAGGLLGVTGLGFCVLSYHDHIRIVTIAENACMDRKELEELNQYICSELETLYEFAMKQKCDNADIGSGEFAV